MRCPWLAWPLIAREVWRHSPAPVFIPCDTILHSACPGPGRMTFGNVDDHDDEDDDGEKALDSEDSCPFWWAKKPRAECEVWDHQVHDDALMVAWVPDLAAELSLLCRVHTLFVRPSDTEKPAGCELSHNNNSSGKQRWSDSSHGTVQYSTVQYWCTVPATGDRKLSR